jgi:hypothetical protein
MEAIPSFDTQGLFAETFVGSRRPEFSRNVVMLGEIVCRGAGREIRRTGEEDRGLVLTFGAVVPPIEPFDVAIRRAFRPWRLRVILVGDGEGLEDVCGGGRGESRGRGG